MLQSCKRAFGNVRTDIRATVSVVTVLVAAGAILVLVSTAPPPPSDAVQASLMYRLVTSL